MCGHSWRRVCDMWVCMRCGMTRLNDGRILLDRKLINMKPKKRKVKNAKTT